MTCDALDNLRNKGKGQTAVLPPEAQEHLRTCERCRALQALWESAAASVNVPEGLEAGITATIVERLKPVSPLPSDLILMSWLLLLTGGAVAIGTAWFGHAGWNALAPWQSIIMFTLLSMTLVLSAHVVIRQMVPGALQRVSPALAIGFIFAALLLAAGLLFRFKANPKFIPFGLKCWERGLVIAAAAAIFCYPVLRRGAGLSRVKLGAATGCLSGLAGLAVLEIYCPNLDRGHIGVWHVGSALTSMLVGMAVPAIWARRGIQRESELPEF